MDNLRKNINAYQLLHLYEDDEPGAPEGHALGHGRKENLDYVEKKVKGVIDRVTVELSGTQAMVFTKLGKRYEQLESALKRLSARRDAMNKDLKGRHIELFDAEDEIYTRVLKTSKIILTLGKMEHRTPPPKFKAQDFLAEVYQLADEMSEIVPELTARIQELEEKHTQTFDPKEISPKFGVRIPKESIEEDSSVADWIEIDTRLMDIYNRMDQLVS